MVNYRKTMHKAFSFTLLALCLFGARSHAEDQARRIKKAVEKSTLDQPGTKPFHLKAVLAPSYARDSDSGRTGEIEIWWESPTVWKREVKCPIFHQVQVVNNGRVWQKSDGDYFPEWLRQTAVELIHPIPRLPEVLDQIKSAEVKDLMGTTYITWMIPSSDGTAQSWMGATVAITDNSGLLFYGGGSDWGGLFHDFADFHGRLVPRTVAVGSPEVTAKITVLEDLQDSPGLFDTSAVGGDPQILETEHLDEPTLRKNLLPMKAPVWPALKDGPLEGTVTTEIVVDRTGKVRDVGTLVSTNPGVDDVARAQIVAMRFQPLEQNGAPVQAVSRITLTFKTARPEGNEAFDTARAYFEKGRKASFLAAGATAPYLLRAEFRVGTSSGVQTGRYEDTWASNTQWKREAWLGNSHFARSRNGDKFYLESDGPDAGVLGMVLMVMEPIPASDTMTESDWRIRHDSVSGVSAIRVFRGPEGPNGELDPAQSQGYWFSPTGQLLKSYFKGFEILPSDVEPSSGIQVARQIDLIKDGKLAMRINVKEVGVANPDDLKNFKLKGHEWHRAFTAEER
jgi:TonB family protein